MVDRSSPDIVALADKLAAAPLDQTHSEWPTIAPVRLSETERELAVNVLRSYARSSAATKDDADGDFRMQKVLNFLNSIEGDGYGGMASFEIARMNVRDALMHGAAQPSLTDSQQDALERMAGHDPRDPGLSWSDNILLIQSAAQAAKDVLSEFSSTPSEAPVGWGGHLPGKIEP